MAFKLGIDSNGNYGYYKAGADSVTPFRTGNATAAHVLSGKTFANASSPNVKGTMTNNGAKTASLNCGGSYTIPAGYHNGSGKITANSLASQTSATATAANISSGKTAWVNGTKLTGTLVATTLSKLVKDTGNLSKTISCAIGNLILVGAYAGISACTNATQLNKITISVRDVNCDIHVFKATQTSVTITCKEAGYNWFYALIK